MQTFKKTERLCSKNLIDKLFETGKSFNSFPFKVIWIEAAERISSVSVVISVPKRSFKKAVDRNKIKRRIREGYRKNKKLLYTNLTDKKILLMLIYTSKNMVEYNELEKKIILMVQRLSLETNN